MSKRVIIVSWILLALAALAWVATGYAAYAILATANRRANDTKTALTKANQAALNKRVQALAESTKDKRDQLTGIATQDIVSIIDTIDAAGKSTGLDAKVSDASVAGSQQISKDGDTLRAVVFNVQGTGTFLQVMHAIKVYENLPLLSSIDQLDIERMPQNDSKQALWHIGIRIRVQTLVSVSI